tara:strand:- start:766 stop:1233 length:468 start_codon:yes stop_codon:yes gene_type:complete
MASKKSKKCPYLSDYGGGYVRPDQWVTERLCALISKRQNSELPDKFWNLQNWKNIFRRQVQLAASLLNVYSAEAISKALRDNRCRNVRSFVAFKAGTFFAGVLKEYQNKYEAELKAEKFELETRSTVSIPKRTIKQNKLSRLKNIDGKTRPIQSG